MDGNSFLVLFMRRCFNLRGPTNTPPYFGTVSVWHPGPAYTFQDEVKLLGADMLMALLGGKRQNRAPMSSLLVRSR